MKRRREILCLLGTGATITGSGCTERPFPDSPSSENENENSPASEADHEFPLPGDPQTGLGEITIQNTETSLETEIVGFDEANAENDIDSDASVSEQKSNLYFYTAHKGTGQTSGSAAAAYQAAWKATEPGNYKLIAEIRPEARLSLTRPTSGHGMASVDKVVQVVDYERQEPIGNDPVHLNMIRIRTGGTGGTRRGTSELAEFIISTAISMALKRGLGLGLIARKLITEVVDAAIELDHIGTVEPGETIYDEFYGDLLNPGWIEAGFSAEEGAVVLFEVAPTITWGYELEESETQGAFSCRTDLVNFSIEEL